MKRSQQIIGSFVLIGSALSASSSVAQQGTDLRLGQILMQLDQNLRFYRSQVPTFFCNEHVSSSIQYGPKYQSTTTDSVFRLARNSEGRITRFVESRDVKSVNGAPATGASIHGPIILEEVFSRGLDTVSSDQQGCMSYSLQSEKPDKPEKAYVVQFSTRRDVKSRNGCVLQEDGSGKVFIEKASMHVVRMELTVPNHDRVYAIVRWTIAIDYGPVSLGGNTFWLPHIIASTTTPTDKDDQTVESFLATYTDYRKLDVTSHIVPSDR